VLPGLSELAADDTIVCRCEDVSLAALRAGVEIHGRDVRAAKMATRAGMGPCQGRVCQALIADLLEHRLGGTPGPPPCPTAQVPVKPVSIATVLGD
jgi:NAD(P)H-nitrite reductase large subunit